MILSWLIIIPFAGGVLAWLFGRQAANSARWIALLAGLLMFVVTIVAWLQYAAHGLLEQRAPWIPELGISYHLAADGLSLLLLSLTALLGIVAVAASWREITDRAGAFYLALLSVLVGVSGVFLARDLLLFYFFWELMLVPMYFLISIWGHERRVYSAIKFFLFTFISSLFMLASILGLVFLHLRATGLVTFDAAALLNTPLSATAAMLLMLGFFIAFAVKLPAFPFHPWLADAHTDAPTGGSIVLAGLLLKTGAYGLLRFAVPLFPQASISFASIAALLGVIGILYGAVLAFAQNDFKRMVAYSSISHMGFVLLGIYSGNEIALQGAVIQMLAHGVSTPALFLLAGSIQERTRTRDFDRLGGLWQTAPRLGGFTLFFAIAALALPGMGNFIGEFLVLLGAFQFNPTLGIVGSIGFVLSVIYALRLVQESLHGPNRNAWRIPDLTARELAALGVLAAVVLWLGLVPNPIFRAARSSLRPVERALSSGIELVSLPTSEKGARP